LLCNHTNPLQDHSKYDQARTLFASLIHRSALRTALQNRDELSISPVLHWCIKSISDYRVTQLTTDVALQVLDLYSDQLGRSEEVDKLVEALTQKVNVLVEASESAWKVLGMVEGLRGGAMDE